MPVCVSSTGSCSCCSAVVLILFSSAIEIESLRESQGESEEEGKKVSPPLPR